MTRPLPDVTNEEFAPFWEGTRRRILRVQQCSACGRHRWPPRPICPRCHALDQDWVEVQSVGSLYSWTVVEHGTVPGIPTPYVVALVELDPPSRVRFLGNVVGCQPGDLQVGMRMEARFEDMTDDVTLLAWAPVTDQV